MRRAMLCLCAVVCSSAALSASPVVTAVPTGLFRVESGNGWCAPLRSVISSHWTRAWSEGACVQDRSTVVRIDLPIDFYLTGITLQSYDDEPSQIDYLYAGSWIPLWSAEPAETAAFFVPVSRDYPIALRPFPPILAEAVRFYALPDLAADSNGSLEIRTIAVFGRLATEAPEVVPPWLPGACLLGLASGLRLRRAKS